jgi:hypothetical protein
MKETVEEGLLFIAPKKSAISRASENKESLFAGEI